MNIVGLSAYFHESACCLLRDGVLVAAAEEERFTRVKHDRRLPINAFRYCLERGRLSVRDIDAIAYYESPTKRLARQLWTEIAAASDPTYAYLDSGRPQREISECLGYDGDILFFDHHMSHAASAYYFSGFRDAAILTVDAVGEWATTAYGRGCGADLRLFEEVRFPNSLGLLYSTITGFLGFKVLDGEYKVMGLASYGTPRFREQILQLIDDGPGGQFSLNMDYFDFAQPHRMYTDRLPALFGVLPRAPGEAIAAVHQDIARSLQAVLEEILLAKVRYLSTQVEARNLCMAGGVALNCVANGRIRSDGGFARMFVQPAAGDSGGCLGAAALAHVRATGNWQRRELRSVLLGPSYGSDAIAGLLQAMAVRCDDFRGNERGLLAATVDRLVAGKIVAWFQGSMEFGPRALGARSILADPRRPQMRHHLNARVKKREEFRPFAPAVLAKMAVEHFDLTGPSRFMLETCRVTSALDLPAVTHVDGSARVQTVDPADNPRFAALLEAFYARTGCPVLVNTSLNVADEPIACKPEDAIRCLAESEIDCLVLEDLLVDAENLPQTLRVMCDVERSRIKNYVVGRGAHSGDNQSDATYTFI
jgi:carbamoyltransferase